MASHSHSRRDLLRAGALGALSLPLLPATATLAEVSVRRQDDSWRGLKVGVASYTLRKLPTDAAIKALQRTGLKYVSIKDFHLPFNTTAEERKAIAAKFRDAGIIPLSCGNVTMQNNEANVRTAFQYAKDAGIPTIVCSPDPASMELLDRMVKEYDIKLAIHNHGPEDKRFPAPRDVWSAVQSFDPRIGLCIDVGHTARAGEDPAESIRKYKARLYDVHLKDINSIEPNGRPVKAGRGVLDLAGILNALLDVKFTGHAGFEYEEDADDPLPGLFESVGYCRGLLAARRS